MRTAGLGTVDVLPARSARPVDVDPEVPRVDLDVDVVVDLRRHVHRRERGVTPMSGVERRLPHQAVYAGLGAQPSVGVLPGESDRGALDTGHLGLRNLDQLGVEPAPLPPSQVHPEQHFGPVLGLGAARAGLDVQERVGGVHLAREHPAELQGAEVFVQRRDVAVHLRDDPRVRLFLGHGEKRLRFLESGIEAIRSPRRSGRGSRVRALATAHVRARSRHRATPARGRPLPASRGVTRCQRYPLRASRRPRMSLIRAWIALASSMARPFGSGDQQLRCVPARSRGGGWYYSASVQAYCVQRYRNSR